MIFVRITECYIQIPCSRHLGVSHITKNKLHPLYFQPAENTLHLHYKATQLMLFRKIIVVYSENHTKQWTTVTGCQPNCS